MKDYLKTMRQQQLQQQLQVVDDKTQQDQKRAEESAAEEKRLADEKARQQANNGEKPFWEKFVEALVELFKGNSAAFSSILGNKELTEEDKKNIVENAKNNPGKLEQSISVGLQQYIKNTSYEDMKKDIENNGGVPSMNVTLRSDSGKTAVVPIKMIIDGIPDDDPAKKYMKEKFAELSNQTQQEYTTLQNNLNKIEKDAQEQARAKREGQSNFQSTAAGRNHNGSNTGQNHDKDEDVEHSKWGKRFTASAAVAGFLIAGPIGAGVGWLGSKILLDPKEAGHTVGKMITAPVRFVKGIFERSDENKAKHDAAKAQRTSERESKKTSGITENEKTVLSAAKDNLSKKEYRKLEKTLSKEGDNLGSISPEIQIELGTILQDSGVRVSEPTADINMPAPISEERALQNLVATENAVS